MKRRLAAFVLVLFVITQTVVFADYYPDDVDRAELSFYEMTEYELDLSLLLSNLQKANELLENGEDAEKILAVLDADIPEDSIDFNTKINLDYIRASLDNTKENNAIYTKNADLGSDIQQLLFGIVKKMYTSEKGEYKKAILDYTEMSDEEIQEIIDDFPTDEQFALEKELNALMERYYNNQFGMYELELGGQGYTLDEILENADVLSSDAIVDYFEGSHKILGPLFVEMAEVRKKIARAAGFESYADYVYSEVYPKDYTAAEREAFYENTKKYIVPLYDAVQGLMEILPVAELDELSDEEILSTVKYGLENIEPELTEAYDYMLEYGLFDIEENSSKKGGAFTTTLEHFKTPYVFINPEGSSYDTLSTLVHEYGHFNSGFHSPLFTVPDYEQELYSTNLDVSEIHSQALELLFMENYGRVYSINSPAKRLEKLLYTLDSVVAACVFSRWQDKVYACEKLTAEEADRLFLESCREFGMEDEYLPLGLGCEWIMVLHNFEVPFYYISYGVSALTALEIFGDAVCDRESGIDKYMRLSALGSERELKSVLSEAGCADIFTEEAFLNVYEAVADYLGICYDDISVFDWYFPYVVYTAYYTDALTDNEFSADFDATRLMVVEALGRMHEDVKGLDNSCEEFLDTQNRYVKWAAGMDIAEGIGDNLFGPDQPITREQVVCFLYRMAGQPKVSKEPEFTDAEDISAWAKDAVAWSQSVGVTDGYTDGSFRPKKNVTRGEAAKLLAEAYISFYGTEVAEDDN